MHTPLRKLILSLALPAAVALGVAAASAVFILTRAPAPPLNSVDGTYVNPCCAPVRLMNGILIAGRDRVPFRLSQMKFGLVAYPARQVRVGPGDVILTLPAKDPGAILFDQDHKGFTLLKGSVTDYDFRRR